MLHQQFGKHWQEKRFPSLYEERRSYAQVPEVIERMKALLHTAVVEHDLVHDSYLSPYDKLLDALQKLTEALFDLCPEGLVRYEVTKRGGIRMLFRTSYQAQGQVYTIIEIGWIYATDVVSTIDTVISKTGSAYHRIAHGLVG